MYCIIVMFNIVNQYCDNTLFIQWNYEVKITEYDLVVSIEKDILDIFDMFISFYLFTFR